MSWAGGTFSRLISGGWTTDKITTPKITTDRHDTNDNDLATGINACVAKDGSNLGSSTFYDDSTIGPSGGKLRVKNNGISVNQLASFAVTPSKLLLNGSSIPYTPVFTASGMTVSFSGQSGIYIDLGGILIVSFYAAVGSWSGGGSPTDAVTVTLPRNAAAGAAGSYYLWRSGSYQSAMLLGSSLAVHPIPHDAAAGEEDEVTLYCVDGSSSGTGGSVVGCLWMVS